MAHNKAPAVPKSFEVPSFPVPSYSTLLKTHSSASHYENLHSYQPIYGNLPPPPPPPPAGGLPADSDLPLPPPPADLTVYYDEDDEDSCSPPPSPVDSTRSSSYSELRRAVCGESNAGVESNYAPLSQVSSHYEESIYEPIHPRDLSPAGSMSSLTTRPSGHLHYGAGASGYGSSTSTAYGTSAQQALPGGTSGLGHLRQSGSKPVQEEEVDALTNLLVQSMHNAADPEFFGMCSECGLKVMGEGTGCTAMDRVFHIACFTCRICNCRLQGKPFYAVDGEPDCQECYLNSLEKCCVCTEPILDRILRATGKPYHPQCFTCIVCGLCLDGIPFTVDAANRIHCIEDFHKKFAPRCSVCHDPILPEPGQEETVRVVALDRSFHVNCYKCEDCDLVLSSEAEGRGCYPLDGRVLCKSCNAIRVNALTSNPSTEL